MNLTQKDGPLFKRPVNIDPKVLATLERAGAERVKLELHGSDYSLYTVEL